MEPPRRVHGRVLEIFDDAKRALFEAFRLGDQGVVALIVVCRTDQVIGIPKNVRDRNLGHVTLVLNHETCQWTHMGQDHIELTMQFGGVRASVAIPFKAVIGIIEPTSKIQFSEALIVAEVIGQRNEAGQEAQPSPPEEHVKTDEQVPATSNVVQFPTDRWVSQRHSGPVPQPDGDDGSAA